MDKEEPTPKKGKNVSPTGEAMATVVCDSKEILLERNRTINAEYYAPFETKNQGKKTGPVKKKTCFIKTIHPATKLSRSW